MTRSRSSSHALGLAGALACALFSADVAGQLFDRAFVDDFVPLGAAESAVGAALPELPNASAAFASGVAPQGLVLVSDSTVQVTFVGATSPWRNTLGAFTWDGADPPGVLDRQLVFPNASSSVLDPGDTVTLRDADGEPRVFTAGTHLGFFLVANGRGQKAITAWDAATAELPFEDPAANAQVARGLVTTVDALNPPLALGRPELARHAALLAAPDLLGDSVPTFLLGFEVTPRTDRRSDHDFNDVVVLVRGAGLSVDGLPELSGSVADPDGDGARGTADAYPTDAERAQVTRVPPAGFSLLLLDLGYPEPGEGDFNDLVLAWAFELVTDTEGRVKELLGHFHLLARSLGNSARFGLHLPGLPSNAKGDVLVERFLGNDAGTHQIEPLLRIEDVVSLGRRVEILLNNSAGALPAADSGFGVNIEAALVQRPAASVRMVMRFEEAVDAAQLGPPPFDPYWMVSTSLGEADVHLAGWAGFAGRPAGLPTEDGEDAFLSETGWPWLLALPAPAPRFPLEGRHVATVYPWLVPWAASRGAKRPNWSQKIALKRASLPVESYLVERPWTLGLSAP